MARIETRLADVGLTLPAPFQIPAHLKFPFAWVRVCGNRAYISGHIAQNADGTIAGPLGKVGANVSPEEGYASAGLVALAHLGSLKRRWETLTELRPGCGCSPWSMLRQVSMKHRG